MCGIAGFVGASAERLAPQVRCALERLRHRGPDGEGWHSDDYAAIGMRRLAIIDLECGDQPIYNEDRTIAVVCNGELYEYPERFRDLTARGHRLQSQSDVNLLPHYYEERGREAFEEIRGMFAAAIWDAPRRRLTLARDRAGKKPLYYALSAGGLAFASEIPALLALLGECPPLHPPAIADYLRLGCVPHPETVYSGVFALPPGATLVYEPGGEPEIAPYWSPPALDARPFRGSRADALEEIDRELREAVALRLRSDVPVGLFLSGGIDSGLVAAYAADAGARDLLCFVVQVADAELNEAPAALATARRLGLPTEVIPLEIAPIDIAQRIPSLYGQPFADSSAIPSYLVAQAASRHRKVVLNGDGGDEIFAGYRRYWAGWLGAGLSGLGAWGKTAARLLARGRPRRSALGFVARTLRGLGLDETAQYLAWTTDLFGDADLRHYFPDLAAQATPGGVAAGSLSARGVRAFMRSDFRHILPDDLLVKMDIATMANSIEARSPFLDIPLVELAWSLPERWLLSAARTKPLLRALAARRLPPELARARKRGFEVPVARWLAHELKPLAGDLLLGGDSRVAALGDARAITDLVRGADGFAGNRAQTVWALLMLEIFLREGCRARSSS
ncbi:MAG TPA: asparagine synthase (glutamine-hydrolyzing) [Gemmatimonadales bacterium]|nr:asparagine synthase (glutamine-hydrolyzing) [Gemmatimonadales bacterium]